jgi:outer membrane protein assembly factor BamB
LKAGCRLIRAGYQAIGLAISVPYNRRASDRAEDDDVNVSPISHAAKNATMQLLRVIIVGLFFFCSVVTWADDWPQWMRPKRDNVWREDGLLEKFPADGLRIVWRTPIAGGYAGPAVAGGKLFVTDYITQDNVQVDNFDRKEFTGIERVLCLNAETGSEHWRHEYPVKYTISYPAGPRCTPIVDDDKVYTLGAEGNLICFASKNGAIIWQKDLPKEYDTKTAMWGYASHPLIDGNKLICLAGGNGTHAVALDKNTGQEIWRTLTSLEQGYSPPTIIEAGGRRQLILARINALTSVDPETGSEYWSVPYDATSGSLIMSPVRSSNFLYVGGYNQQNLLVQLAEEAPGAEIVWRNKAQHGISPVNVQPFVNGGTMYGFDQNGRLYAIELPSGKRLWDTTEPVSERPVYSGTAFIVRQGDEGNRYWLFNEHGDLIIATLTPEGYEEIDRAPGLIEPTNQASKSPLRRTNTKRYRVRPR